jgi:threonine/homoserine/homoserine lactone efflux protein
MARNAIHNCRKLQLSNPNIIVWLWAVRIAFLAAQHQQNVNFTMGVCNDVLAIWKCSCCNDGKANVKNSIIHQRFLQCAGMFMMLDIAFPYL